MEYIILDLEWNQGDDKKEEKHAALPFEVIEIGAVKLDERRNVMGNFHRIIRPVVYPKLFEYTKKLIELTEKDLQQGVTFEEAARDFLAWCGASAASESGKYRFCTWGPSDLTVLQQNLDYFGVKYHMEYPLYYCDVQQLYGIAFEEERKTCNLEYAVRELKLTMRRPFHGALYDAEYTAEVFERINPRLVSRYPALDLYHYPARGEEPICIQYPEYRLTVSGSCVSKEAVRQERCMMQLYCCVCGRRIRKLLPWFSTSSGGRGHSCLGQCRQHGYMKGRLLVKNPAPSEYFGIQTIRLVSKEEGEQIKLRYKERRKKHK